MAKARVNGQGAGSTVESGRYVDLPLHGTVEAVGALAAIVIATVLLHRRREAWGGKLFLLAVGFLGMGLLDVFHAVTVPGRGFVLLHAAAGLVGGFWFALTWVPRCATDTDAPWKRWMPGAVAAGCVLLAIWTLASRETLPSMLVGGAFTPAAVALNLLAGALFMIGAARLLLDFHRLAQMEIFMLACIAALFGLAGLMFPYAAPWDATWWVWHLLRLTAYLLALRLAIREYRRMASALAVSTSEREQAMGALQAAEERYHTLFESAPDGTVVIDPVTTLPLEFNDAACQNLDYSRAEFARLRVSDYEAIEQAEETSAHVKKVMRAGWDAFDTQHRTRAGEIRHVAVRTQTVPLAGRPAILCIYHDITARIRGIEERSLSEARFRSLFENMIEGFAHCRMLFEDGRPTDFIYLDVNRKFGELTGLTNVVGKRVTEILPGILESNPELFEIYGNVALTGKPAQFETCLEALGGRWLSVTAYRPEPEHFVAVFENITERKQTEEQLIRLVAELRRSNAELERFSYVASHDLQEPLRMVASYTQLLARRYKGKLDADADAFIGYAVDGATRMQQMINDLLAYSRVGTKGQPFEPTDSAAVLSRALDSLGAAIRESGAVVTVGALPTVTVDGSQLQSVFQNLLANAMKFRGSEPPRVHVSAKRRATATAPERSEWEFSVSDNGVGIDPAYHDRIFVVFQRLQTQRENPGSGIGLSICQRVVERHGGRIRVESEPGKGAAFIFTIPEV
jgi:PAS domain S-box-containing protein